MKYMKNHEHFTTYEKCLKLTGKDFWNTVPIDGVFGIRFADGPSGLRVQEGKGDQLGLNKSDVATCFPTLSSVACSWDVRLAAKIGRAIGEEASGFNVDVVLAPGLNIKRSPLCGRNFEYFSEDPYLTGKLGAAWIKGVKSAGVQACVKHFAVNNREWGRMVCDSVVDERTLREIYLTGFEIAVTEGAPAAVMTAYNKLNGVYCSCNDFLIGKILRGEWGFGGITVSDWGGVTDTVARVKAGLDLEMPHCALTADEIYSAVTVGELPETYLDDCVDRLLSVTYRINRAKDALTLHGGIAEEAAAQCQVLLKNDGVLPFAAEEAIAVIGDLAKDTPFQGGGSSAVNAQFDISLLSALSGCNIAGFARGYSGNKPAKRLISRAVKLCKKAKIAVVALGGKENEGMDRKDISLPPSQTELLKNLRGQGVKIVVVLYGGSAYETQWDEYADAVLYAGLCGQGGARATADILTGKINPSGKLAETFPVSAEDSPCFDTYNESPYYSRYTELCEVGYRRYAVSGGAKYPFGFGLSYTTFAYSHLRVDGSGATFEVTNTGEKYGGEISQMYITFPPGANCPPLQLKGFAKVFLAPGESARISVPFDKYTFRSYDTSRGAWAEVSGKYLVRVGGCSADLPLEAEIIRAGDCESVPAATAEGLTPSVHPVERTPKGRVIATPATPFCELKNAKGFTGRLLTRLILRAVRGKPVVYGTMEYLPLRVMAQFARFGKNRFEGFMRLLNGRVFSGLFKLIRGDGKRKEDKQ